MSAHISKKIPVNPWDCVYRKVGEVFTQPNKNFPSYLELIHNLNKNKTKILDLGCGTGRHLFQLAELGYHVYGVDQSPEAIRIIKENLKHFKKSKVTLDQADIFSGLPYPDNCFDSIISIAVIYHSTLIGIHNIINEIKRVLKKGGSFFFTTSISVEYSMSVNSGSIYIPIEKGTYFPLDGRERYLCHHYFTKNEIIDLLKDDFKDINIFDDKENYYVTSCIKK